MSDARIVGAFATLSPSNAQLARMQARIESRLAAAPRSIAGEWLAAVRARPLVNGAWVLAAAAILFLSTPLAALPSLAHRAVTDRAEVARANERRPPADALARAPAITRPHTICGRDVRVAQQAAGARSREPHDEARSRVIGSCSTFADSNYYK